MANENEWEKTYEERINWVNSPDTKTPIDQNNLNKIDKAVYEMDDRILALGKINKFTLLKNSWYSANNSNLGYAYYQKINTTLYSDDSTPLIMISTNGKDETQAERDSIDGIVRVWVDTTGITVYAKMMPTVDLQVIVKGY